MRSHLCAVIIPNAKVIDKLTEQCLLEHSATVRSTDRLKANSHKNVQDRVKAKFYKKLRRYCHQVGLNRAEIPKDILLVNDEWTPNTGLVTASFKLKRKQIEQHYNNQIQKMLSKFD